MLVFHLYGRLAQLVERHFDVVDVRGSTPLSPTRDKNTPKGVFLLSLVRAIEESKDGGRKAVLRLRRAWPWRGEVWQRGTHSDGGHTARPFEIFSEISKRCTAPVRRRTLRLLRAKRSERLSDS